MFFGRDKKCRFRDEIRSAEIFVKEKAFCKFGEKIPSPKISVAEIFSLKNREAQTVLAFA